MRLLLFITSIFCAAVEQQLLQAGHSEENKTTAGVTYNLRTPINYKPTVAHPLIVVFANPQSLTLIGQIKMMRSLNFSIIASNETV